MSRISADGAGADIVMCLPFFFWREDVHVGRLRGRIDDCFVGLSFPRAPVTLLIIIGCFESPATTFGLVKATRLTASLGYERELFIEN